MFIQLQCMWSFAYYFASDALPTTHVKELNSRSCDYISCTCVYKHAHISSERAGITLKSHSILTYISSDACTRQHHGTVRQLCGLVHTACVIEPCTEIRACMCGLKYGRPTEYKPHTKAFSKGIFIYFITVFMN